jgi:hypothetical protein
MQICNAGSCGLRVSPLADLEYRITNNDCTYKIAIYLSHY